MANDQLLKALIEEKKDIVEQLSSFDALRARLEDINTFIEKWYPNQPEAITVKPTFSENSINSNGYNKNWTLKEKVAYVINKKNRFIHVREIAEYLRSIDNAPDVEPYLDKVRNQTTVLRKEGALIRYTVGGNLSNSFWGSPNWIKEGEIIKGHEYTPELVIKNKVSVG